MQFLFLIGAIAWLTYKVGVFGIVAIVAIAIVAMLLFIFFKMESENEKMRQRNELIKSLEKKAEESRFAKQQEISRETERVEEARYGRQQEISREAKEEQETRFAKELEVSSDAKNFIDTHNEILSRKFSQLTYKDDYGRLVLDPWISEREYFYTRVLVPYLLSKHGEAISHMRQQFIELIDQCAMRCVDMAPVISGSEIEKLTSRLAELSATEYEFYCAKILQENGWDAKVTKASGDQGVDVIAKRNDIILALQCKKLSSPAGNFSVQEVLGGVTYYRANMGAVVCPSGFTKSARQLANTSGVMLIHESELAHIFERIIGQ
jgi:restriction system protein